MNPSSMATKYYMAFNRRTSSLYVSFPVEKTIMKLKYQEGGGLASSVSLASSTWKMAVGSGKPCVIGGGDDDDDDVCGDGLAALDASLTFPKVS